MPNPSSLSSPFLLIMEILACMLSKELQAKKFKPRPACKSLENHPSVFRMTFGFFGKAISAILDIIQDFRSITQLAFNHNKTSRLMGGIKDRSSVDRKQPIYLCMTHNLMIILSQVFSVPIYLQLHIVYQFK